MGKNQIKEAGKGNEGRRYKMYYFQKGFPLIIIIYSFVTFLRDKVFVPPLCCFLTHFWWRVFLFLWSKN
jgi:hypothetical protein